MWADPQVFGLNSSYPGDTMYDPLCVGGGTLMAPTSSAGSPEAAEACPLAAHMCQQGLTQTA